MPLRHTSRTTICSAALPLPTPSHAPPLCETPLQTALKDETERIRANFFCPGHKQGSLIPPSLSSLLSAPLHADVPELPALDNLASPVAALARSQALATATFTPGTPEWRSFYLVNGSTVGIQAAIMSILPPFSRLALPRNAHQSAVSALVLAGVTPVWTPVKYLVASDVPLPISATDVRNACEMQQVRAVFVVSPTYHGLCADIPAIVAVAAEYNARVIVDEAHGAHFKFHPELPAPAAFSGPDVVVQSTHKTLTAMSQAAMLHVCTRGVEVEKVSAALQMLQTSSPNYILLASLEAARALMDMRGRELWGSTIGLARECARKIDLLDGFSVLGVGTDQSVWGIDRDDTRLTVLMADDMCGFELDERLIDRFGVYAELPSFRHLTFVFTPGNTRQEVDLLVSALAEIGTTIGASGNRKRGTLKGTSKGTVFGEATNVTPREAFFADAEIMPVEDAVGRICVQTLCPYPPGIPVLVPGERVSKACINVLQAVLKAGGSVSGACDESLSTIRVMKSNV